MTLEVIRLSRNILLRTFVVSFALAVIMASLTLGLWDQWSSITCKLYRTSPEALGAIILGFFAQIKFFYIFILLAPALALHWTLKSEEKKTTL